MMLKGVVRWAISVLVKVVYFLVGKVSGEKKQFKNLSFSSKDALFRGSSQFCLESAKEFDLCLRLV